VHDRVIRIKFPAGSKDVYFLQGTETCSAAYLISYSVGIRGQALSVGIQQQRHKADHSPLSNSQGQEGMELVFHTLV
jgi:hypothetical protein